MRVGYACVPLGDPTLRSPRTTVLRRATPERLRALIAENIAGLARILAYNEAHGLRLFRIGSAFIPFGSHPINPLRWWEEFAEELAAVGTWALRHDHRLSFHASYFAVLNSEREEVAAAARAEIEYQARALAALGLPTSHRVVLHMGVTTPDKRAATERLRRHLDRLSPGARQRVILENDEARYSLDEVVAFARREGLPVVADLLHHRVCGGAWRDRPVAEMLAEVFTTWRPADGPPKVHFSSQAPIGSPGAHGDWIDAEELAGFLAAMAGVPRDFDLMFGAKAKDLAARAMLDVIRRSPIGSRLVPALPRAA